MVCSPLVRYGTTEMTAMIIIIISLFKVQCRMLRLIMHKCGRKEKRLGGGGVAGQKHCLMPTGNRQSCSVGMLSAAVRIQPHLTNLGPSLLSHQHCQRLHLDRLSVKSVTLKHISDQFIFKYLPKMNCIISSVVELYDMAVVSLKLEARCCTHRH